MTDNRSLGSLIQRALRWTLCDSHFRWWTAGCTTGIFIGLVLGAVIHD